MKVLRLARLERGPNGVTERFDGEHAKESRTSCSRLRENFLSAPATLQEYASKFPFRRQSPRLTLLKNALILARGVYSRNFMSVVATFHEICRRSGQKGEGRRESKEALREDFPSEIQRGF